MPLTSTAPMVLRMTTTYHWFAILGLLLIPCTAIILGISRQQPPMILGGSVALFLIIFIGSASLRNMPKLMEISSEGLYVKQYKRQFDWRDIKQVYVIDMAERMSQGQKIGAAAAGNHGLALAMLIGLEFTEQGLNKHGVLADKLWQKQHDDHAVIRTHMIRLGKGVPDNIPDLVKELEQFREAAIQSLN